MIDCHVHLAALRTQDNGCYISPGLLNSPLFRFLRWKHRLPIEDAARSNQKYVEDLLSELRRSRYVEKAVLLGMDGVYDSSGRLDEERTEFLVGNDYAFGRGMLEFTKLSVVIRRTSAHAQVASGQPLRG